MPFLARRGRPPKFTRPARAVTVTLPEDVIETLSRVDRDIGRAIVRLSMPLQVGPAQRGIEVATFGSRAVIVVAPSRALAAIDGVELVPLADGRAIIALDDEMTEAQLELLVRDALEADRGADGDREMLQELLDILRDARRSDTLTVRRIIVLRARASVRSAPAPDPAPVRPRSSTRRARTPR